MNALTTTATRGGIPTPSTMADAMRLAEMLATSSMVPQTYRGKPGDILVAVQMGAELGLSPMQALQNIASINGRPSVWGDAALGLAQRHPLYAGHREWLEGEGENRTGYCAITRRGSPEHVQRFSMRDAKKAGLLGKQGPWQQYTDRMLVLRARGFALRDKFADALRGLITTEEAMDMPGAMSDEEAKARVLSSVVGLAVANGPALPAPEANHPMNNPNTMQSQGIAVLDNQLAMFGTLDDIRGYLADPKVQRAHQRAIAAGRGDEWSGVVQAHIARVSPDDRENDMDADAPAEPGEGE